MKLLDQYVRLSEEKRNKKTSGTTMHATNGTIMFRVRQTQSPHAPPRLTTDMELKHTYLKDRLTDDDDNDYSVPTHWCTHGTNQTYIKPRALAKLITAHA